SPFVGQVYPPATVRPPVGEGSAERRMSGNSGFGLERRNAGAHNPPPSGHAHARGEGTSAAATARPSVQPAKTHARIPSHGRAGRPAEPSGAAPYRREPHAHDLREHHPDRD